MENNIKNIKSKLIIGFNKKAGRNNNGRITIRSRGGGFKRKYRFINFKYNFKQAEILTIEYDPNRNSHISLIKTIPENKIYYIITPNNVKIGDTIKYESDVLNMKKGTYCELKYFNLNQIICQLELYKNKGSQYFRACGSFAKIIKQDIDTNKTTLKLASGKILEFSNKCLAYFGRNQKQNHRFLKKKYKAGQNRNLGKRPIVRGVAKNPIDHPHGGGEGKSSGGRCSVTPWGFLTKGRNTVKKIKKKKFKNSANY